MKSMQVVTKFTAMDVGTTTGRRGAIARSEAHFMVIFRWTTI